MNDILRLFDDPRVFVGAIAFLFILALLRLRSKRAQKSNFKGNLASGLLGQILFWWSPLDQFRVRDLLNGGVVILGRAGSGKTSSSGRTLMASIVGNPNSGMLTLCAKPEDPEDIIRIFKNKRRMKDLIIFDADNPWRFNFLDYLGRNGEPRNVVQCLTMIGETLKRGEGGDQENRFYKAFEERILYNAVAALKAAGEPITAERLFKFIICAPTSQEEMNSDPWKAQYHFKVMIRADAKPKKPREEHDYRLCKEFWAREYVGLDNKTRSNGLAGVMNVLHVFNTGLVREMVSGETNCSPDDILNGKTVLVNFPPSVWGEVGSFISTGWKYLTQLAVLKRKVNEASPFVTIWNDEAHLFVNEFDQSYLAQCRSHRGCLVSLSQSVSSFYVALRGSELGRQQTNALLANFSHVIVHASDPETAKWAASKLGRRKEILSGGSTSQSPDMTAFDRLYGNNGVTASWNEHYEQVLQDQAFMIGRTGGPENNLLCDSIVIKSGETFADGKAYKRVTFSQE
jgi:hypothetical protein